MSEAKTRLDNAKKARQLQIALENEGYGETYAVQMKLGEYVDWTLNELFMHGTLERDDLDVMNLHVDNDTIEHAAKERGCSIQWFNRLIKEICRKADEGLESVNP